MSEIIVVATDDGDDTPDVSDVEVTLALKVGALEVEVAELAVRISALQEWVDARDASPVEVVHDDGARILASDAIDAVTELSDRIDELESDADTDDFAEPVIIVETETPVKDDKPEHWLTRPWGGWFK